MTIVIKTSAGLNKTLLTWEFHVWLSKPWGGKGSTKYQSLDTLSVDSEPKSFMKKVRILSHKSLKKLLLHYVF